MLKKNTFFRSSSCRAPPTRTTSRRCPGSRTGSSRSTSWTSASRSSSRARSSPTRRRRKQVRNQTRWEVRMWRGSNPGLPDFSWYKVPKRKKYAKCL
jgi:hypothetical protein